MYQVLIVDDEPLAIEGIEAGVRWNEISVGSVRKAYNIRQAKDVFGKYNIDVMLCDIEMPQGNGLDLLSWAGEHYPNTKSIVLTCHADFDYARKALQLGSIDYILKSMTYGELEVVISKAIRKLDEDKRLKEFSHLGTLWCKNKPYLIERFWLDIVNGNIPSNDVEISHVAVERNIFFSPDQKIRPMLINIISEQKQYFSEKTFLSEIEKMILKYDGQIIERKTENILCIFPIKENSDTALHLFIEACNNFALYIDKNFNHHLFFYIGDEIKPSMLANTVSKLFEMEKNNVTLNNRVVLIDNNPKQSGNFNLPYMNEWFSMISEKEYASFIKDVTNYCESLVKNGEIDSSRLQQFHQDFLQMIYSLLKQKKIPAHQILSDTTSINLFERATKSVPDMLRWIKHVVIRIQEDSLNNEISLSVIEKVKRYIAIHIADNPSRDDLGNYVYLNPDYLTRLFKKETGMTLISYCQNVRMKYAKDLLLKSNMSVSKVAAQVGYSNFSHFSRAFKEFTGINPTEFKNKYNGDN
jgi:two-component system, response regulator YesN